MIDQQRKICEGMLKVREKSLEPPSWYAKLNVVKLHWMQNEVDFHIKWEKPTPRSVFPNQGVGSVMDILQGVSKIFQIF